jgi:DNA-binding NarL/FixJ family response regulator
MTNKLNPLRIRPRRSKLTMDAQPPPRKSGDSHKISAPAGVIGCNQPHCGPLSQEIRLTRREIQVLRLMAIGLENKEIGAVLSITEGTVKIHVHKILSKLDVSSRKGAIARVLSEFLL